MERINPDTSGKDHPGRTQDRLETRPPEAVYIGDSAEDIAMARAAGVPSIAIPGPYPNHPSLLAARPDRVAVTLRELIRF